MTCSGPGETGRFEGANARNRARVADLPGVSPKKFPMQASAGCGLEVNLLHWIYADHENENSYERWWWSSLPLRRCSWPIHQDDLREFDTAYIQREVLRESQKAFWPSRTGRRFTSRGSLPPARAGTSRGLCRSHPLQRCPRSPPAFCFAETCLPFSVSPGNLHRLAAQDSLTTCSPAEPRLKEKLSHANSLER